MKKIIVTGPRSALTETLTDALSAEHYDGDPRMRSELEGVVDNARAVIHADAFEPAAPENPQDETDLVERASLGTYVLCDLARKAGVDRIIVISSLRHFDACPDDFLIDEMWRPRPMADARSLAPWLAESSAREFAREGGIHGICLRFRPIGGDPETETRLEDAVDSVRRALELPFRVPGYRWHVFHVASSVRYLMRNARNILGFERKDQR